MAGNRGRTVWLIDGAYMLKAQSTVKPNWHFDYRRLRAHVEKEGQIAQAYYFNSTPDPPTDQQNAFHTLLKLARPAGPQFVVRLYGLKEMGYECASCGTSGSRTVQKGVDVGIATAALKLGHANVYDTLMLSTGDGDFHDMVEHVKTALNKRVELVVFGGDKTTEFTVSPDLQSFADRIYWINDFAKDVERETFAATCARCSVPIDLPFKPNGVKPVFCRECLKEQRLPRSPVAAAPAGEPRVR